MLDFDLARNAATFVSTLLGIGAIIFTWVTSRSKTNSEQITALSSKVNGHGEKIQALEAAVKNQPSKDTVHALDKKVTELNGTISVVAESLKAVERTAHRIENFLLDQAARK